MKRWNCLLASVAFSFLAACDANKLFFSVDEGFPVEGDWTEAKIQGVAVVSGVKEWSDCQVTECVSV